MDKYFLPLDSGGKGSTMSNPHLANGIDVTMVVSIGWMTTFLCSCALGIRGTHGPRVSHLSSRRASSTLVVLLAVLVSFPLGALLLPLSELL